jgi:hypothetical protein
VANGIWQANFVLINQTSGPEEGVYIDAEQGWVPAGSSVALYAGWTADTAALVEEFLSLLSMSAQVGGELVPDMLSHWVPALEVGDRDDDCDVDYASFWEYHVGVPAQGPHQITAQ